MSDSRKNRVGRFLRDRRLAAGMSLRDAADRMGVSHVFLGEVERGKKALAKERWDSVRALFPEVRESDLAELSSGTVDLQLHLREAGARYERIGEVLLRRAKQQDELPDDEYQAIMRILGGPEE